MLKHLRVICSQLWAVIWLSNAVLSQAASPQNNFRLVDSKQKISGHTSSRNKEHPEPSVFAEGTPFSTYEHTAYPSHGLRLQQTLGSFCDDSVRSFTGYLDTNYGTKHFFFYFFESRNNPDTDDVVVWLNGGMLSLVSSWFVIDLYGV